MNLSDFKREDEIVGEDEQDTEALKSMARDARTFLGGFSWCPPIERLYLAEGIGGVVAVFLVKLRNKIPSSNDDTLWVIVGDLPSVYLVTDQIETADAALAAYCELMDEWVDKVRSGASLKGVYPVPVAPSLENAAQLSSRISFLRSEVLAG